MEAPQHSSFSTTREVKAAAMSRNKARCTTPGQKRPADNSTRQMKLEGDKQQRDMWWEMKPGEQQDLRAAGKAEARGKEAKSETLERNRAADSGGRKR